MIILNILIDIDSRDIDVFLKKIIIKIGPVITKLYAVQVLFAMFKTLVSSTQSRNTNNNIF